MDRDDKAFENKMIIFLIELPVFLLLTGKGQKHLIISIVLYILTCAVILLIQRKGQKTGLSVRYPVLTILICTVLGIYFYRNWNSSGRILSLSRLINKPPRQSCVILASFLAVLSVFGVDYLLKIILEVFRKHSGNEALSFSSRRIRLYIFLTSFFTITLNSKCSPVYPLNDWFDPNAMFTVGKGVLKGFVPYRDLYEQKGPLLLFFHTFGAAVSFKSFVGMWILEILFCCLFLVIAYKTASLFFPENSFMIIPVLAFAVYSSYSFRAGDSAEEFCLPLLSLGLYLVCKAFRNGTRLSKKDYFWIGITSGCVFWIKYSMLGFYLGWIMILFIYAIIEKKLTELIRGGLFILSGVIISSLPVILYFAAKSSLGSLWEAYFYNNLFTYTITDIGIFRKISSGLASLFETNGLSLILAVLGFVFAVSRRQWKLFGLLLSTFIGLFLSVYSIGRFYPYYSLIFSVFSVFGLFFLIDVVQHMKAFPDIINKYSYTAAPVILLFCLFLVSTFSYNLPFLENEREDLMQFKMKSVIENSGIENPTLFYYRKYDAGITTVTGIIPNLRYFCSYNNKALAAADMEQDRCIREGCSDFIITRSGTTEDYPEFDLYDHLGSFEGTTDWGYANYHYFMRKQEN